MPTDLSRAVVARYVWAGALLLVTLAFCPALEQPGWAPREALLVAGAPFLLALGLVTARARPPAAFLALVAVPLLAGAAGVLRAPDAERACVARDLLVLAAPWIVAAAATLHGPRDGGDADEGIECGATLALLVLGPIGLAQAWWGWSGIEQGWPPAATFVNRGVAAQALVALVPLAVPVLLHGRRSAVRWAAGLGVGAGLALLVATRTRGAWLGAAVGCALGAALWLAGRRRARLARPATGPIVLAVAVALVALLVPVRDAAGRLPGVVARLEAIGQAGDLSGTIRLALWRNTLALVGEHPLLGVGAGRFPAVYPLHHEAVAETPGFGTQRQAEHAHQDLLETAAELGLPAAAAWLALLLTALALASRSALRAGTDPLVARCAARAAVVGGVLTHALFAFPLHDPAAAFLCWLAAGRAWSERSPVTAARRARALGAVCALALAAACAWLAARELRAQAALREALQAVERRDGVRALAASASVRGQAPWRRRDGGIAAMVVFECEPDPRKSLLALEPALAMHPHQLNLLLATGARRLKAGASREAVQAYRHATEIAPRHAPAWVGLALASRAAGDPAGAAAACSAALRIDDDLPAARAACHAP
jgi:O-antigen ligase